MLTLRMRCLHSRGISGVIEPEILDTRLDENGTSYAQAARAAGYVADSAKVWKAGYRRVH